MNSVVRRWFQTNNDSFKIEWLLFILLLFYLAMRAVFVPPLHDEVATFFHYIETGNIWSNTAVLDANNHLLNSYLSRLFYLVFGDHFFVYRVPNLLAFIFYFWGVVKILRGMNHRQTYYLALIAMNTIPFVLEYFSLTRGYGLGMAFFVYALSLSSTWVKNKKYTTLTLSLCFAWLSVFANLIFINSFALLVLFSVIFLVANFSSLGRKKILLKAGIIGVSFLSLYPLINFGLKLKNSGALYYGSLDGLWDVTGNSLSRYVFFTEHVVVKWLIILLLAIMIADSIRRLLRGKLADYFKSQSIIVNFYLFGNIAITWALALVMEVNFPEDRAGIYFVLLFILSLSYLLDQLKWWCWSLVLIFFPAIFFSKINLSRTIVTPDQTLSVPFYDQIKRKTNKNSTLQVYPTQALVWAYYQRKESFKKLAKPDRDMNDTYDYIVTREPFYEPSKHTGFKVLGYDELTKDYILENKLQVNKGVKETIAVEKIESQHEYNELFRRKFPQSESMEIYLTGSVSLEDGRNMLALIVEGWNSQGESVYYKYYDLRWYYGIKNTQYQFELNHSLDLDKNDVSELVVYIWNRQKYAYTLSNISLELNNVPQ